MTDGLKDSHREAIIATMAANDRVERAVLFGSRATQTNTVSSDVDIALFGDRLTLTDQARLAAALDEIPMAQSVDLLLYDSIQNRALRKHIRSQGVEWYARPDPEAGYGTFESAVRRRSSTHEWHYCTLADACSAIDYGLTASASNQANGPRFLRITDIVSGAIDWNSVPYVEADDNTGVKYRLYDKDIVLARTGASTGVSGYIQNPPRAVFASYLVRLQARPSFDSRFLAYYLRSEQFWEYLRGVLGDKSAQPNASASTMTAAPLRAPRDIAEQRAIAYILGTLDDKIELNRRMNATLEAMARALFKSWFVDFDPVRAKMEGHDTGLPNHIAELFPDRLVDSELGATPQGWEVSEIGREVEAVGGSTPSTKEPAYWIDGRRHWVTPKDLSTLSSLALLETKRKITDAGIKTISSGLLPVGTVLLSSRAPIGYLAIAEVPTAVNQDFIAMVCKKRLPNLYVLFWCYENLDHLKDISGGSTFAEISRKTFRTVPAIVPSKEVLTAYEDVVRPLYDRIVANIRESATLIQTRDLLLSKLVSGEIRIRDAEKAAGAVT